MLEEEAFGAPERAVALYRRMLELGAAPRRAPSRAGAAAPSARRRAGRRRGHRARPRPAEGAERASREIEIAQLLLEPLSRHARRPRCVRARAGAVAERLAGDRGRREAAPLPRDARPRRGHPRAGVRRQGKRAASSGGTRGPHRHDGGKRGSPRALRASGRRPRAKLGDARAPSTSSRAPLNEFPAELALWDRLAVLAAKTGRTQAPRRAIVAVVPPRARRASPRASSSSWPSAPRTSTTRSSATSSARARTSSACSRGTGQRARVQPAEADPDDARALGPTSGRSTSGSSTATAEAARRTELLAEIALVAEEITGDRAKAIAYYERILELDPVHEQASARSTRSTPARAAVGEARAAPRERMRQGAAGDERLDAQAAARDAPLREARRSRASALDYLEQVFAERSGVARRGELVEKILEVPALRRARGDRARGGVHGARRGPRSRARARDPPRVRDERRGAARRCCAAWRSSATSGSGTTRARSRPTRGSCRSTRTTGARASACSRSRVALGAHERAAGVLATAARGRRRPCRAPRSSMDLASSTRAS